MTVSEETAAGKMGTPRPGEADHEGGTQPTEETPGSVRRGCGCLGGWVGGATGVPGGAGRTISCAGSTLTSGPSAFGAFLVPAGAALVVEPHLLEGLAHKRRLRAKAPHHQRDQIKADASAGHHRHRRHLAITERGGLVDLGCGCCGVGEVWIRDGPVPGRPGGSRCWARAASGESSGWDRWVGLGECGWDDGMMG